MGWCAYAHAPIERNACLVSCHVDIAITPRSARDRMRELLAKCAWGTVDLERVNQPHGEGITAGTAVSTRGLSSWLDHQNMCLYLILTRLGTQMETDQEGVP